VRNLYEIWVGMRLSDSEPYWGVRDGGYMLLYAAWLGRVHPDAAVRAEFRELALRGARDYYARLQMPDGSWRWREDTEGNPGGFFSQPLMIGILLEGMIATHQLTGDPTVRQSIIRAVDNLYTVGYRTDSFDVDGDGTMDGRWRGMWYFTYGDLCTPPVPGPCGEATRVRGGDSNVILEVRQLNPLTIHAFGYAYKLTGDAKYRTWGDEIFSATFGNNQGPGADAWTNLAAWGERGKEYNQSYRTAGRYLAWRAGR
jgi:hypothetical protein